MQILPKIQVTDVNKLLNEQFDDTDSNPSPSSTVSLFSIRATNDEAKAECEKLGAIIFRPSGKFKFMCCKK